MIQLIDCRTKEPKPQDVVVLHISDLHLRGDSVLDKSSRKYAMAYFKGQLRRVERKVPGHVKPVDIIAVTGDLADYERADEKAHEKVLLSAKAVLEELATEFCSLGPAGLLVIPGNHDYRWTGNISMPSAQTVFARIFEPYFIHKLFRFNSFDLLTACIDSNRGEGLDWARGQVDMVDLETLDGELFALRRQLMNTDQINKLLKLSLVHHHPFPVPAADRTIPTKAEGIFFKKPVAGASEYMLLRNAGVFVNKLLAHDFRLVLHGHLHENGYWRVVTRTPDRQEGWLEVISGGSLLKGKNLSFNTARFLPSGFMEVTNYAWDGEGNPGRTAVLPSAPYEIIRTLPSSSGSPEACSKLFSQFWTVKLGKGDWESVEIVRGYRAMATPVREMKILTTSEGLTSMDFSVEKLGNGDHNVGFSKVTPDAAKPDTVNYFIRFEPALQTTSSLDFVCRYLYRGVMNRSAEDLRCLTGLPVNPAGEWDWIFQRIPRPTEQMVVRLQFEPDPAAESAWVPEEVHFDVIDETGIQSEEEKHNGHLIYDRVTIDEAKKCGFVPRSQALLTVYRPRIGYTYILKWKLQEREQIPNEVEIKRRQVRILRIQEKADLRQKAVEWLIKALAAGLGNAVKGTVDDISAFLFAYRRESQELVCVATTGSLNDPLYTSFKYGQDVVGTAFRRREAIAFVRSDNSFQYFRRLKDDGLAYLIGCPINFSNESGWPVGVVAFASRHETSHLDECCRDKDTLLSLPRILSHRYVSDPPC